MRDAPEQPTDKTGELDPVELHHRGFAADSGEVTGVAIDEGLRRSTAFDAGANELPDITAHLLGGGRDPGNGRHRRRGIADRENLRMPRHAEVRPDLDPAGAVVLGLDPLRGGRGDDAGGPDDRFRIDTFFSERNTV